MKGLIEIKILVDADMVGTSAFTRMQQALLRQHELMMEKTGNRLGTRIELVTYVFKVDGIKWGREWYQGRTMYTPTASYIQEMTDEHRGDADFLQMVILQKNWKPPVGIIGGLNSFITQVLQASPLWGVYAWFITFEEELVHSFDQIASRRLGIDFNELFDVRSYDNAVVHGADPRYTRSKYGPLYKKAADILIELFPDEAYDEVSRSIEAVRAVFGPEWTPPPIFYERGLVAAGEVGAVRIKGQFKVRTIGENGKPLTAWQYFRKFGTISQKGIVGVISPDQAFALGIR